MTLNQEIQWFYTHPSPKNRIAAAERQNQTGVFALQESAEGLFENYPEICRDLTFRFYDVVLGLDVMEYELVPVKRTEAEFDEFQGELERRREFWGEFQPRLVAIPHFKQHEPDAPQDAEWERFHQLAAQRKEASEALLPLSQELDKLAQTSSLLEAQALFERAGLPYEVAQVIGGSSVVESREGVRKELRKQMDSLRLAQDTHRELLELTATLLSRAGANTGGFNPTEVLEVLRCFAGFQDRIRGLVLEVLETNQFLSVLQVAQTPLAWQILSQSIEARRRRLRRLHKEVLEGFGGLEFSFEHEERTVTVAAFLAEDRKPIEEGCEPLDLLGQEFVCAERLVDRLGKLYQRSLAHLAAAAQQLETARQAQSAGVGA